MHGTENFGSGLGFYLYCLYQGRHEPPDLIGIDGEHKLFSIARRDVSAAVSLVSLEEFGEAAMGEKVADLGWIAPRVLAHEQVIEKIMAVFPVMPMRFRTIFSSSEKIGQVLDFHRPKILRFFSETADKEEWGIKGYIDRKEFLSDRQKEAEDPALEESSPGKSYLLRKKRDLAVKDELSGVPGQIAEELFRDFLSCAVKGVRNRAIRLEGSGESKGMILNAAFLVPKGESKLFRAKVRETEEKYRGCAVTLSLTGPWPPYHFCPMLD